MLMFKIIIVCATVVSVARATNLPSYIKPCQRSLPKEELSSCILGQARNALPLFVKGVPELGIESMDPLVLDDFTANAGTFKLKETKAVLKGLSKMEIREMKWDLDKNVGTMKIFGNLTLKSDYEADGRVLVIPITGTGKLKVYMYDTEIYLKFKLKKVKGEDGRDHLLSHDLKATQTYGNVKLHLSNILGGATLGETINQVLNDNWRALFDEVGPAHTKSISAKVHEMVNKMYEQTTFGELFV